MPIYVHGGGPREHNEDKAVRAIKYRAQDSGHNITEHKNSHPIYARFKWATYARNSACHLNLECVVKDSGITALSLLQLY